MAKSISKAELQTATEAAASAAGAQMSAEAAETDRISNMTEQEEASFVETVTTTYEDLESAQLAKAEAMLDATTIKAEIEAYDDDTYDLVVMHVLTTEEAATVSTVCVPVPAMPKLSDLAIVDIFEQTEMEAKEIRHSGPVANMIMALTFLSTL